MATEVVKIIDPDNGSGTDYTSLSAWEAGMQKDLPTADEVSTAKCRCTGGTADTTAFTIDGWTTDATRYIKIWTDPSESYRHTGKWNDSKYRHVVANNNNIIIKEQFFRIIGLQFKITSVSASDQDCIQLPITQSHVFFISHCIFRGISTTAGYHSGISLWNANTGTQKVYNCIFYDFAGTGAANSGYQHYYGGGSTYLYNCTFKDCVRALVLSWNATASNSYFYIKNCLFSGCGNNDPENTNYNPQYINCATSRADFSLGTIEETDCRKSQTFTFVDSDNDDFHLASNDAGALGYGKNLYDDADLAFQDDIDGQDRGGSGATWDIGADEYVSAGDTFSEAISDGIAAGESLARISTFRNTITDGFSGGESMARRSDMTSAAADGSAIAEALARIITAQRTATDGATIGESTARNVSFGQAAADGIVASDAPAGAVSLSLSITDGALIGDQAARRLDLSATLTDGATLGEVLATALTLVPAITDGVKFAETLASDLSGIIDEIITDGFKAGESVSSVAAFIRAVADGAKLGDSLASVLSAARAVADGIKAGDQVARVSTAQRSATDSIVLSEVTAGELVAAIIQAIAADGVTFGEATQTVAQFDIVVADGVRLAETVAAIMQMLAAVADAFNAGDAAASIEAAYIAQGVVRVTFTGASGGRITFTVRRPTITFTVH